MCTAIRNSCDSYIYFLVATYIAAVYTKQKHLILQTLSHSKYTELKKKKKKKVYRIILLTLAGCG